MSHFLLFLALAVAFIFGWNNSGLCTGGMTCSGIFSYRSSLLLTTSGFFLGSLLEGSKMQTSLVGTVTQITTTMILIDVFLTTLIIMVVLTLFHIPVSISNVIIGTFVGASIVSNLSLNLSPLLIIVFSWIFVPFLSALLTIIIYSLFSRLIIRLDLLTLDAFNRYSVAVTVFYIAYALGANNIGLLDGLYRSNFPDGTFAGFLSTFAMAITASFGVIILGKRITKTVGEDLIVLTPMGVLTSMFSSALLMWTFTQISIPISITQAIIGGVIGASIIKKHTVFNRKVLYEILGSWVIAILIGFILSALLMRFL